MKAMAIRELENRLSAYLREVTAGEVVLVTDRGRVIADSSDRRPVAAAPHFGLRGARCRSRVPAPATATCPRRTGSADRHRVHLAGVSNRRHRHRITVAAADAQLLAANEAPILRLAARASLNGHVYCHTLVCVRFVWNARKAAANLRKHGVSFDEAATAFDDELGAYFPDTLHEDRFILLGYSRQQRLLYVVHAEVTADTIRIISARKATRHERTRYENG